MGLLEAFDALEAKQPSRKETVHTYKTLGIRMDPEATRCRTKGCKRQGQVKMWGALLCWECYTFYCLLTDHQSEEEELMETLRQVIKKEIDWTRFKEF